MVSRKKTPFRNTFSTSRIKDLDPDEILLDAENLPRFNTDQFEGRIEKPISVRTFAIFGFAVAVIFFIFLSKAFLLQAVHGSDYFAKSENNHLHDTVLFANRGIIFDRTGMKLAWNEPAASSSDFNLRAYTDLPGLSHAVGYVSYPSKDSSGFYYDTSLSGEDGAEQYYNDTLSGQNGTRIVEVDASGNMQSQNVEQDPVDGKNLTLSIDAALSSEMYTAIASLAKSAGYTGGAGVIMDVHTGEVLALTSYPEYSSQVMTDHTDSALIKQYLADKNNPFLDRVTNGLYTPGSIVKPFIATGALAEHVIDPSTKILSTGSISLPNPYDPAHPSVFKDWRAQGWVDMEHALAVSSDVYFYEVGGGFENQKGLGITMIDTFMNLFGFGDDLPGGFFAGTAGTIPTPAWKAANFNGDAWRIGDTYHTAIGQYGFQVTPIQAVRADASLANGGILLTPSIIKGGDGSPGIDLHLDQNNLNIVRAGMRLAVTEGVAGVVNAPYVDVAAKTGTAQLGARKQFVNSWVTGFFPYQNPQYAFAIIMEKGPVANTMGATYAMRQTLDWMDANRPEYLGISQ